MQLSGNTILITGATSGLGLAFAEAYLQEGSTVIICGRRAERLQQIKEQHPNIITKVCDVADETQRRELHAWATEQYPALNILMNNAGMQLHTDLKQEVHIDNVRQEIETNLVAPIHLSSLFAPHLGQHSEAAIMNISSGLSFVPIAFMPVYCATKAAIHSLTMSLRWQLRKTTVKVFEIAPPSVDTELGHQNRADKNQIHGGIPISEFMAEALEGIRADNLETLVGMAKGMNAKRDELFEMINSRFEQ
jgi:uncharacterized oxidoreductase